jgi:hypothetical protein
MHRRGSNYFEIKQKMTLVIAFVSKVGCMYIKSTTGSWYGCSMSVSRSCGDRVPSFHVSYVRAAPCSILTVSFRVLVGNKAVQTGETPRPLSTSKPNWSCRTLILRNYSWLQLGPESFICRVMTCSRVFLRALFRLVSVCFIENSPCLKSSQ